MVEYKITRVQPMVDIDASGRFFKKYRVYFTFKDIEDFIDVREEEFKTENVKKLIEQRVKEISGLLG
ncbi:MAG: hypothetical protein QXW34_02235 [Candidatus Methanomethyliaceae archaeon]